MEHSEKKILITVAIVLAALIVVTATAVIILRLSRDDPSFVPPEFDPSAVVGTPQNIDGNSGYGELALPISGGRCTVSMSASPVCEGDRLNLFFTSDSDNTVFVRVIVYTADGVELGSSGLLRPGEYLPSVTLANTAGSGSTLRVKILTYEPETYYSMGSAGATIMVR